MAFTGMEWIIVIIAIVLLLFGAKKIPEFARNLGKAKAEFQRGQIMVEKEIREAEKAEKEQAQKENEAKERAQKEKEEKERVEREKAEKEKKEEEKDLQKAARELGIDPEDKTDEELKELIKDKVSED